MKDLIERALDAAQRGGAAYADVRVIERETEGLTVKNGQLEAANSNASAGFGVRVLVDGAWGFAGDPRMSEEGARDAALRAVSFARASASRARHRVELAPLPSATGEYAAPLERDPVDVPLEEKIALCLGAEEGMRRSEVKITEAMVRAMREHRVFRSSEGTRLSQRFVECGGGIDALAVSDDGRVQNRSYPSAHGGSSGQAGWEYVVGLGLDREAPRVGEEAAVLLTADLCPAAVTTIVVDAEQMLLQVHESVGHPTELDRVYGTEAAYAGTSFLKADDLGSLRYGSEHMNITADPTTPLGLGTFGWDDEGAPARRQPVVENGILTGYLASRETSALIGRELGGSMRADNWSRMPLVRMTNLHLEPGTGTLDDLLADVDDGLYLCTNKSWSIDDKRLNFQFGTQVAWEIKKGKLRRMLRDPTYTGVTPEFWGRLDAVAGPETWQLHGLTNCGKGQPGQHAHVSHGTAPARFRDVQVGVRQ